MVWSREPVYLAAMVTQMDDGSFHICEYSLRGLSKEERDSLKLYLENFGPKKG